MGDEQQRERTQLTQPKRGEPVEIPVPKERDVLGLLERMARTSDSESDEKSAAT